MQEKKVALGFQTSERISRKQIADADEKKTTYRLSKLADLELRATYRRSFAEEMSMSEEEDSPFPPNAEHMASK